jgi:hypothetical protein
VDPILQHAIAVSDNVNYVSTAIRGDVQRLNDTVTMATRRLNRAAEVAENRIGEFNALLEVVQEEAESLFVNTAATVRGVQVGTETFRRFRDPEGYDPYEDDPRSCWRTTAYDRVGRGRGRRRRAAAAPRRGHAPCEDERPRTEPRSATMPRQDTNDFLSAFAIGTVLGVGAALLLRKPKATPRQRLARELKPHTKRLRKSYQTLRGGVREGASATG